MKGLRELENNKFENFFKFVQDKAKSIGKVFFIDCGEGRELFTDDLEGEDLSGWLIPLEEAETFEKVYINNGNLDKWVDNIVFAIWKFEDKKLEIEFKSF